MERRYLTLIYYVGTGIGDRILDMCGLAVLRDALGARCAHFVFCYDTGSGWGTYDVSLLKDTPVTLHNSKPQSAGMIQVFGSPGVSLHPVKIFKLLKRYGLTSELSLQDCWIRFGKYVRALRPASLLEAQIPSCINECIGIHLRKSDKVVEDNPFHGTTTQEHSNIMSSLKADVLQRVQAGQKHFFVCSEDREWKNQFVSWLSGQGSDIHLCVPPDIVSELRSIDGVDALLDFFCLSRCKIILQGIGYSTFSMTASIVGESVPLINYSKHAASPTYFVNWWSPLLKLDNSFIKSLINTDACEPVIQDILCNIYGIEIPSATLPQAELPKEKIFKRIFKPIVLLSKGPHTVTFD